MEGPQAWTSLATWPVRIDKDVTTPDQTYLLIIRFPRSSLRLTHPNHVWFALAPSQGLHVTCRRFPHLLRRYHPTV
jgi:hypothetical protein